MARPASSGLPTAVYLLIDPHRPNGPCYVGSSNRPKARFYSLMSAARAGKPGPRMVWIRRILQFGKEPKLEIVGWYKEEKAAEVERDIYFLKKSTSGILNEAAPSRGGIVVDVNVKVHEAIVKPVGRSSAHVGVPAQWIGKRVRVQLIEEVEYQ